jgi:sugar fermentation stimulation protein A
VKLFRNDLEAPFVRRPNRFLIIAQGGAGEIACHCPNPGRLIEFLLPGAELILEKREEGSGKAKTPYTAVGIMYRGAAVPLFSARANRAAETLILNEIIEGLAEIRPEYTLGDSRFDFLCTDREGRRHLVEVKACSLIEQGVAMFPDAPSGRALKHLEELARLGGEGYVPHVLFVIVHGKPEVFIPNLHTDPQFAAALCRLGVPADPPGPSPRRKAGPPAPGTILVHAALLRCNRRGAGRLVSSHIPVDLSHRSLAQGNGGDYLILLELPEDRDIETGALGTIPFKKGWYLYAGSARKNLSSRVARHLRREKKQKHWHLDYLTPYAGVLKAFPIMSYRGLECELVRGLIKAGGLPIPGFGSSDCRGGPGGKKSGAPKCPGHLVYFADPPLRNRAFLDLLFRFRHIEGLKRA